eukprot:TRINITY_DN774221_c0_g1_i1.p1 TRINITY_DN774221_c0_g1~~TRINITY_DN774221_c0_g1_i1.p1  ORF type:complete len:689 (-),score=151.09 TRINITY_DN774221_c0_g1_i1:171-2237(-)
MSAQQNAGSDLGQLEADVFLLQYLKSRKSKYPNTVKDFEDELRKRLEDVNTIKSKELLENFQIATERQDGKLVRVPDMFSDTSVKNHVLLWGKYGGDPVFYEYSFSDLHRWILSLPDCFQSELVNVLYPLFVHCYIALAGKGSMEVAKIFMERNRPFFASHSADITNLIAKSSESKRSDYAHWQSIVSQRFNVQMSEQSYKMLLDYLNQNDLTVLTMLLHQYVRIEIVSKLPLSIKRSDHLLAPSTTPLRQFASVSEFDNKDKKKALSPSRKIISLGVPGTAPKVETSDKKVNDKEKRIDNVPEFTKQTFKTAILSQSEETLNKMFGPEIEEKHDGVHPSAVMTTMINSRSSCSSLKTTKDMSKVYGTFDSGSIRVWDFYDVNQKEYETADYSFESKDGEENNEDKKSGSCSILTGFCGPAFAADIDPQQRFLISGGSETSARLWHLDSKQCVSKYNTHSSCIWDVAFSPMGYYFATASADSSTMLWCMDREEPIRIYSSMPRYSSSSSFTLRQDICKVAFHPNCCYLASAKDDHTITLFDIHSVENDAVRLFDGIEGTPESLAFSCDGKMLACGSSAGTINVFDIGTGSTIYKFSGHKGGVWSLDFDSDSKTLVSGSQDCSVKLWDVAGASPSVPADISRLQTTYYTKSTPVHCARFYNNNLISVLGAYDSTYMYIGCNEENDYDEH